MIRIYMDDLRPLPTFFFNVLAVDGYECLEELRKHKGKVQVLSLDHDLGEDTLDGYDVVKAMVEEGLYADRIYLHTANPTGRDNMYHYLKNAIKHGVLPDHIKVYYGPIPFVEDDDKGEGSDINMYL